MSSSVSLNLDPYQPQSLDHTKQQIRLVSISPSSTNEDQIQCAMAIVDLKKAPPFTALSYVWGPPDPRHQIILDGGVIDVRVNLHNFLYEFRKQETEPSDQYLWIDQICIDQKNIPERSHQVSMMSDIYKGAESVIAWLGDGTQHPRGPVEHECVRYFSLTGQTSALYDLRDNEYFGRLWVVQEFLLARRVRLLVKDLWLSDQDLLPLQEWDTLQKSEQHLPLQDRRAPQNIDEFYEYRSSHFGNLIHVRRPQTQIDGLYYMLACFRFHDCEDPRDKVYGLLGLVDQEERIVVDYTKSVHQVFMDAVLVTCRKLSTGLQAQHELNMFNSVVTCMPFTRDQKSAAKLLFSAICRPEALGRFEHLTCPITAIGFEPADEVTILDRWWFDFLDTRYYVECVDDIKLINTTTQRLWDGDWEKYLPE